MICLLQRVAKASVEVETKIVGDINQGLMVLVGFETSDASQNYSASGSLLSKMADRLLGYRVFSDEQGKMNLNVLDVSGGVLLVPQFTLAAQTSKGLRPGFQTAATPEAAKQLFDRFLAEVKTRLPSVQQGRFGADMKVSLVNDGPVTFWLQL